MSELFFSSDPHFGHENILKFVNYDGDRVRPEFDSIEDMDETLVERHNSVVGPNDKWYCLGDVSFKLDVFHRIMPRLNGKKRLILGNHDTFHHSEYYRHFEKIQESWQPQRHILFTHRPVWLTEQDPGHVKINVHGHVHRMRKEISPCHHNISCEMTNYTPISWDELHTRIGLDPKDYPRQ